MPQLTCRAGTRRFPYKESFIPPVLKLSNHASSRRVILSLPSGYCEMNICLFQVSPRHKTPSSSLILSVWSNFCQSMLGVTPKHSTPYIRISCRPGTAIQKWHALRLNSRLSLRHLCTQLDFGRLWPSGPVLPREGIPDLIVSILFHVCVSIPFFHGSISSYMFKFIFQP